MTFICHLSCEGGDVYGLIRRTKRRKIMARHSRIKTDVKPVRKIDIVNASKDELIEYLCQTIHFEVEKGEDADCDLIRECSDWLDELTADEIVFAPEELDAKLEALKSGKDVPISNQHKPRQTASVPRIKRKVFVRVGILVATIMLLSVLSLSVMAKRAGYDSTWEYIVTNVNNIVGLRSGEKISEDGITIVKNAGKVCYENMENLIKNESLNILYPTQLPGNLRIKTIRYAEEKNDSYTLYFTFSNPSYVFNVSNYYLNDVSIIDSYECLTVNSLNFYYTHKQEGIHYAILQYNGYEYTIQTPNYDDMLIIINSMKG